MLLTLFITVLVAGIGLWFYKRKQIEALNEQLRDKDAIISALTAHVDNVPVRVPANIAPPVKPSREGTEKNIKPAPTRPRPNTPKPQEEGQQSSKRGEYRRRKKPNQPPTPPAPTKSGVTKVKEGKLPSK